MKENMEYTHLASGEFIDPGFTMLMKSPVGMG